MSQDKRRHTRIYFRSDFGPANQILGAQLVWPNQEISDVFDISYKGLAVSRPGLMVLTQQQNEAVELQLGGSIAARVPVQVVWLKEQLVGLELGDLSADQLKTLHDFLTDKLIGQHLHPIDPQYFSSASDFQFWYEGPNSTHVFLWTRGGSNRFDIERALVELDDESWEIRDGKVVRGFHLTTRVLQILSQLQAHEVALHELVGAIAGDYA